MVTGKKLVHWGGSLPWARQHLSDDNPGYVKIQAGLFDNQATYEVLESDAHVQFSELWMGGRAISNGVSRANEYAILSLQRTERAGKSELVTQLGVTYSIECACARALWRQHYSVAG